MLTLWRDARYALRMMVKSPAVSAVMVLTLAVGIGATTVMFSVIDAIILEPYTYKDPAHIAHFLIHDVTRPKERGRTVYSAPEFMDYAEQTTSSRRSAASPIWTSSIPITAPPSSSPAPGSPATPSIFTAFSLPGRPSPPTTPNPALLRFSS